MALPTPPKYSDPIPNNPFYSPLSYLVQAAYNPFIVGSGLFVSQDGTLSSTGSGGAVSGVFAGAGINVSSNTGMVTISNSGVTSLVAGSNITLSGSIGAVTISASGLGTVTSITAGVGLNGGTITSAGTISLPFTGVVANSYVNPTITIDAHGRITSAASGTALQGITGTAPISVTAGTNPVVSVAAASTTGSGVVQLSDSVTSTSSTTAATSLAVKTTYDAAIAAVPKSCYGALGTILTAASPSTVYALPIGADNKVLTACVACTGGVFWGTPPQGTITSITAGNGLLGGTITSSGTLSLNTSCVIPPSTMTAKGGILTATAASVPVALPVGANGQVLAACSAAVTGLCWITPSYIQCSAITGAGALITGTAANTVATLAVGSDGQVLTACSANANGLCWATQTPSIPSACITGKGALVSGTAASTPTALSVGTDGQVLTACSACAEGLTWETLTYPTPTPNYGSFYDTTTQTNVSPGSGIVVRLNTTDISNNVSVVTSSKITPAVLGVYNLQFSIQLSKSSANKETAEIWLRKNGVDVPQTNTEFTVQGSGEKTFAALNYLIEVTTAGDFFELVWASGDTNIVLLAAASSYGGPSIPSAIVTVVPVGA